MEKAGVGAATGKFFSLVGPPKLELYDLDFRWGRPRKVLLKHPNIYIYISFKNTKQNIIIKLNAYYVI